MALFHLSVKSGSRGAGQSAAAHGEYIAREGKYAEKAVYELAVHVEHGNLPEFAEGSAHAFWRAADAHERANGRLWSELEVSLPRELSREAQLQLARDFRDAVIGERHAYTMAIHVPKTMDGESENPHIHLMFSERVMDARTIALDEQTYFKRNGATKDRAWNDQDKVEEVRKLWEGMANEALQKAGLDVRIDRRSLVAQGIDRLPEPKIGKAAPEVRRAYQQARSGQGVIQLSERAQTAMQVRSLRQIDMERSAVVIELAQVRAERARKVTERTERLKRYDALPLNGLRAEARKLAPDRTQPGEPVWEKEWANLPQVAAAVKAVTEADASVGKARGVAAETARRLQRASSAEQDYKKAHRFRAGLRLIGFRDGKLDELMAQRSALEMQVTATAQNVRQAETIQHAAEQTWHAVQRNPELRAHAIEIHGDKVDQWNDIKQVLERREAERHQAEALTEQLAVAHRLRDKFDRGRIPETVRGMLASFDLASATPGGLAKAQARMADTLTRQAELRQIVDKALTPQAQAIERELQQQRSRSHGQGR